MFHGRSVKKMMGMSTKSFSAVKMVEMGNI